MSVASGRTSRRHSPGSSPSRVSSGDTAVITTSCNPSHLGATASTHDRRVASRTLVWLNPCFWPGRSTMNPLLPALWGPTVNVSAETSRTMICL